jgi:hypothetical protein
MKSVPSHFVHVKFTVGGLLGLLLFVYLITGLEIEVLPPINFLLLLFLLLFLHLKLFIMMFIILLLFYFFFKKNNHGFQLFFFIKFVWMRRD